MSIKVGIQLYSVRQSMQKNAVDTLEKVAAAGYKFIEPANHFVDRDPGCGFGVSSDKMNEILNKFGAKVINTHIYSMDQGFDGIYNNIDSVIEYHQKIGNFNLTLAIDFFSGRDEVLRKCEIYNKIGKKCHDQGSNLLYHNHFQEFQRFNGKTVMDIINENTDPDYLGYEMDLYWVARSGEKPTDMVHKYGNRIKILHQKDFPSTAKLPLNLFETVDPDSEISMETFGQIDLENSVIEIGTGTLDIQANIDAANKIGIPYIVLEQDYTKLDEIESIKVSMNAFRKFHGISWE